MSLDRAKVTLSTPGWGHALRHTCDQSSKREVFDDKYMKSNGLKYTSTFVGPPELAVGKQSLLSLRLSSFHVDLEYSWRLTSMDGEKVIAEYPAEGLSLRERFSSQKEAQDARARVEFLLEAS